MWIRFWRWASSGKTEIWPLTHFFSLFFGLNVELKITPISCLSNPVRWGALIAPFTDLVKPSETINSLMWLSKLLCSRTPNGFEWPNIVKLCLWSDLEALAVSLGGLFVDLFVAWCWDTLLKNFSVTFHQTSTSSVLVIHFPHNTLKSENKFPKV